RRWPESETVPQDPGLGPPIVAPRHPRGPSRTSPTALVARIVPFTRLMVARRLPTPTPRQCPPFPEQRFSPCCQVFETTPALSVVVEGLGSAIAFCRRGERQPDGERAPRAFAAGHLDAPAVLLDDLARAGQAEAGSSDASAHIGGAEESL